MSVCVDCKECGGVFHTDIKSFNVTEWLECNCPFCKKTDYILIRDEE